MSRCDINNKVDKVSSCHRGIWQSVKRKGNNKSIKVEQFNKSPEAQGPHVRAGHKCKSGLATKSGLSCLWQEAGKHGVNTFKHLFVTEMTT